MLKSHIRLGQHEVQGATSWLVSILLCIRRSFFIDRLSQMHEDHLFTVAASRQMKFMGAAHFTLRCGRQLGHGSTGAPAYQLPLVALVCNFGSAALASDSLRPFDRLFPTLIGSTVSPALHDCGPPDMPVGIRVMLETTASVHAFGRACRSWRRCITSWATPSTQSSRAHCISMCLVSYNKSETSIDCTDLTTRHRL